MRLDFTVNFQVTLSSYLTLSLSQSTMHSILFISYKGSACLPDLFLPFHCLLQLLGLYLLLCSSFRVMRSPEGELVKCKSSLMFSNPNPYPKIFILWFSKLMDFVSDWLLVFWLQWETLSPGTSLGVETDASLSGPVSFGWTRPHIIGNWAIWVLKVSLAL